MAWAESFPTDQLAPGYGMAGADAALAALAIEHGATLATTDRDFSRFAGLRTLDPLQDSSPELRCDGFP